MCPTQPHGCITWAKRGRRLENNVFPSWCLTTICILRLNLMVYAIFSSLHTREQYQPITQVLITMARFRFQTWKQKLKFRSLGGGQRQDLETESPTGEAVLNTSGNLDGSSSLNLPLADSPFAQTSPPGKPTLGPLPSTTNSDKPIRELWNVAYEKLRAENEELIAKYETKICEDLSASIVSMFGLNATVRDRMHAILQLKIDGVNRDT